MNTSASSHRPGADFVVTVQFSIAREFETEFMHEMVANARSTRENEPGCTTFDVCVDPTQPGQVFLYEIYRDAAAFEQHKREPHFLAFDQRVAPWVLHKTVRILTLIDA